MGARQSACPSDGRGKTIDSALDGGRTCVDDQEKLRERFDRAFANWDIELPADAVKPGIVWLIVQRGWTNWTRFDTDTEDGRAHLDYYAMHRMTDDRHVRLYADGEKVSLPVIVSCLIYPADATRAGVRPPPSAGSGNDLVRSTPFPVWWLLPPRCGARAALERSRQPHTQGNSIPTSTGLLGGLTIGSAG